MNKMNKDFQKILILWAVSIIISWITLYSYKDIKFKNTKKLQEQQQSQEQQTQQEYEELIANENIAKPKDSNLSQKTTGDLNIIFPSFLLTDDMKKLYYNLETKGIKTNFYTTKNLSEYKRHIIGSGLSNYDVYLLPSTWLQNLELETINIWDNPKVFFHQVFNNLISVNNNKYIPYSIDPLVTITKENVNIKPNWENIFSYTTLWTQNKSYSMPLIRGIGKNDIRLLERWEWSFENHFEILKWHLESIKNTKKSSELKNMLDTENIDLPYKYNFAKLKQLTETIWKRDLNCELFPAICLISYNFWDIKFGYISDLDILQSFFSWNNNLFDIKNFPNSEISYPIKWRIFVVPDWNKNINLANEFFKEYLSEAIENNTWLRNNTFSAVNNTYEIQKNNNIYKNIISNENNFKLIQWKLEDKINQTTTEMLKWNVNPELYLNGIK